MPKSTSPTNYNHQAKKLLFTTFNCAKSQVIPLQEMYGMEDTELIMGLTGLAGGVLNNGSTCGVVLGGAAASAMIRDKELEGAWTLEEEIRLLEEVRREVVWFENRFRTSLCRERDDLPYERITVLGLLNPQKAKGCVARAGASMDRFVEKYASRVAPPRVGTRAPAESRIHCAQHVLEEIRARTGVGDTRLERISIAFDGGVGLSGGSCGALSGALMALGLRFALDPSRTDPKKLRNIYRAMDSEFFSKAKILLRDFLRRFGAMECSRLAGKRFEDWEAFQTFRQSDSCEALNTFLIEESVAIIEGEKT